MDGSGQICCLGVNKSRVQPLEYRPDGRLQKGTHPSGLQPVPQKMKNGKRETALHCSQQVFGMIIPASEF